MENIIENNIGGCSTEKAAKKPLFIARESLLTIALREDQNIATSFALVKAITGTYVFAILVTYAFDHDFLMRDVAFVVYQFSPIHVSLAMEVVYLMLAGILVFAVAKHKVSKTLCSWIVFHGVVFLTFVTVVAAPIFIRFIHALPIVLTGAMVAQQIRVLMKFISFLYEKNEHKKNTPTIKSMMYFMFAPTLIYQYSYPRSKNPTNWKLVVYHLFEWTSLLFGMIQLYSHTLPVLLSIGKEPMTIHTIRNLFLTCLISSAIQLSGISYCFLHAWGNMWSEILRFGDRHFYGNYWSAKTNKQLLSSWNLVITIWIARYVYVPVIKRTGSKVMAGVLVATISAMIHDYVYSICLGFFFPFIFVLSLLYIPLLLLNLHDTPLLPSSSSFSLPLIQNIIFNGIGGMVILIEFWCRQNCDDEGHNFMVSTSCLTFDFGRR